MKTLFVFSFILVLSQCNKYDDVAAVAALQVPPYTETGANTFGCYVNGKAWANIGETYVVPAESFTGGSLVPNTVRASIQLDYKAKDSVFSVNGTLTDSKKGKLLRQEFMTLSFRTTGRLKGLHSFTDSTSFFYANEVTYINYGSLSRNPFTVNVKNVSIIGGKRIVSGTFNGTLYNAYKADSVIITGGVFDAVVH